MASVNFMKLKSPAEVKCKIRHCDRECRKKDGHRNKHIDKSLTDKNIQVGRSYAETCKRFDDRIAYLDSLPKANKKQDRVICFALEFPAPKGMRSEDVYEWSKKCYKLICDSYGGKNVVNYYLHRDEQHDYTDSRTGEQERSRTHIHAFVIPEVNGKLNGKVFSSANRMRELNQLIHDMTLRDYGMPFMDGTKRGSRKTVEQLKQETEQLEAESHLKALRERERVIREREQASREMLRQAEQRLAEARTEADRIITEAEQKADKIITDKINAFDSFTASAVNERKKRIQERNRELDEITPSNNTDRKHTPLYKP